MLTAGQPIAAGRGAGYLAWLASKGFTQAQFDASGFGIDVTDSGVDNGTTTPNHFGLYRQGDVLSSSRVAYARLVGTANSGSTLQGCDGHGTLNAHIIAGWSDLAGAPFTDDAGFAFGLGVAPFVKIGSSVVFDPAYTNPSLEALQARAWADGMRISSNSWGSSTAVYTIEAQRYDALVRDAQPAGSPFPTPGHQEMVIVFAAGNAGPGASTIASPGSAKNVITVGASENVQAIGGTDYCGVADSQANSRDDIANFSSRGPTADGRTKPDLVAPGTHVSGGVAQTDLQRSPNPAFPMGNALGCFDANSVCGGAGSEFYPSNQQWYTVSSGTSHSTPAVAGAAALLRQHLINRGEAPPSPAMTKAWLMNAARYLTGTGANDSLFSNAQGMGLADLERTLDDVPRMLVDQTPETVFTASGQQRTFEGIVGDPDEPFRVTLAWTDAPGSTTGSAWQNDLDLLVTVDGVTYRGNVFDGPHSVGGGTADPRNNVESVFLPAGTQGTYTITVVASNVVADALPDDDYAGPQQDFALVVYNACDEAGQPVTDVAATPVGDHRIEVTWTPSGSDSYNVYRALSAAGPWTRAGSTTGSSFVDAGLSGGTTYFYQVRGVACSESAPSNVVSATATGDCILEPAFDGLQSVTSGVSSTCSATLSWSAATPRCGGAIHYSIHRSTDPAFVPSAANRVATGVTGTTFVDEANLAENAAYHYVVRATETADRVIEEQNTVARSAMVRGPVIPGVDFFDDFDGNRPANASAWWTPTAIAGNAGGLQIVTGCRYQSFNRAYRFGAATTSCGGTYAISQQLLLRLGGDGSVVGINGFPIPAAAWKPEMSFHVWYAIERRYDGAWLVYSTSGANGPWLPVGDAPTDDAPYIFAGGYDNTLQSNSAIRIWTTSSGGLGDNGSLKQVRVNLEALKGQTVWFGFRFHSDNLYNYEGFYVDDVRVLADSALSCTTVAPPPGPAVSFVVEGLPASAQAGTPVPVQIVARDAWDQVAVGYGGAAQLSSSDPQAVLPAVVTFVNGVASAQVEFRTAGTQRLVVTDDATQVAIQGAGSLVVEASDPVGLFFYAEPAQGEAGRPITPIVAVGLLDAYGNQIRLDGPTVEIALGANPGGATLSGTTSAPSTGGFALFANLVLDKAAEGYTLVASAPGLAQAISAPFAVRATDPARLVFVVSPADGPAGVLAPAPAVAILDAFDNRTDASALVELGLEPHPGGASLGGVTAVQAVDGIAVFDAAEIDRVGEGYVLRASSGALTGATSAPFSLVPAAPHRLAFTAQPTDVVAGAPLPTLAVTSYDRFGNVASNAVVPVHLSLVGSVPGATLSGTAVANTVDGVATFPGLSVDRSGPGYTLVAASSGLLSDASAGFDVLVGAPAQVAIVSAPASVVAGAPFDVVVAMQDAAGNVVPTATGTVTLQYDGALVGSAPLVSGVASFPEVVLQTANPAGQLVATSGPLASISHPIVVEPGAASALQFLAAPTASTAGGALAPAARVAVNDAFGNRVKTPLLVTLTLQGGAPDARLTGTPVVATVDGEAHFPGLSIDRSAAGYTLVASAGSLPAATSPAFEVHPAAPARLVFVSAPASAVAGAPFTVAVAVEDGLGNRVDTAAGTVSLSLDGAPLAAASLVDGVATFADLVLDAATPAALLEASYEGIAAAAPRFPVAAAAASRLVFLTEPSDGVAGALLDPAPRVAILDAWGNRVEAATRVSVALTGGAPDAVLNGTRVVEASAGVAVFPNLSINRNATGYALVASAESLEGATSAAFDVLPGEGARLVFRATPGEAAAGVALDPIEVELQDAHGNLVGDGVVVELRLGTESLATATASAGVARFEGIVLEAAGPSFVLQASAAGFETATSPAFAIHPGAVAGFEIAIGRSATAGRETPFSVRALDAFGNLITGFAGEVRFSSSDPAATLPAGADFAGGEARLLAATFRTGGTQTLTVEHAADAAIAGSAEVLVTPFEQPKVAVLDPVADAVVSGTVKILANAEVDPGTSLVELAILVDGEPIATGSSSVLVGEWDTSGIEDGSAHVVTARARDAAGNEALSAPVAVTVERLETKAPQQGGGEDDSGCGCSSVSGSESAVWFGLFALFAFRRRRLAP